MSATDSPSPRSSLGARLGALLASPRARVVVPLVGVLLTLPSIAGGLALDDLAIRARALGRFGPTLSDRLDLFNFFPVDAAARARLTDEGFIPWYASPDQRIAFFRPLSAALHFVDFQLFGRWPWVMHVESLALYAALVTVAGAIYRRFLPAGVAMLAALLYAVDDAHGVPVGWVANRNALVAALFGFAAIFFYDRARRDANRAAAWLGVGAFALSLLGGESGIAVLAYLAAHAVTMGRDGWTARARVLAPYAGVVVAWQAVYRGLGYGAHGSGAYLDPVASPVAFFAALPGRALALFLGLFALPRSEAFNAVPRSGQIALALVSLLVALFIARGAARHLRASPEARFFALGALLSLVPIVAVFPDDRLLTFAGLGAFGLVAGVIGDLRLPLARDLPRSTRVLRRAWMVIHLGVAPLVLPLASVIFALLWRYVSPPAALTNDVGGSTVVLVDVPSALTSAAWLLPSDATTPVPARARVLAATTGHLHWAREDARTVRVELAPDAPDDPFFFLFRDPARPLHQGDTVDIPGMRAEVVSLDAHDVPRTVRYLFDRPLDDPQLRWFTFDGGFRSVAPPR